MSPKSLAGLFDDGVIKASYANFGFIPYGQSIMGQPHIDSDNDHACNEYDGHLTNEISRNHDLTPFFFAIRGNCSFVQKVRNMENLGAAIGIIVDDHNENIDGVLMSDDGTGGGIRIPSMLIGKKDGMKLHDWWNRASEEERKNVVVMAEFVMPYEEDNKVSWDFWMTSSSDRALDFLEDFQEMQESLSENVNFHPHYVFWECNGCDADYIRDDCFAGGDYCAVEPSNDKIKGRDIIKEDLRQKCLFKELSDQGQSEKWWQYIQRVHSTCYSVINEDCSWRAHKHLELDWDKTESCVTSSFSKPNQWDQKTTRNSIIEQEIGYWKEFGTNIYPSIVINKKTYRGQIDPISVFNALCAGFENPPQQCWKTLKMEQPNVFSEMMEITVGDGVTWTEVIGLVFGLILLNVMVVYCCRRRARREMQQEMQMQIESQVSQYFALTQQKQKPNNDARV